MTLIALPSSFRPETFSMRLSTNQRAFASPFGGSEQVIDLVNERWEATLTLPKGPQELVASREACVNAMRGMTNTVALYHWARPIPRGTMRGAPVAWGTSSGSATLNITTTAGATLLAGDMVGLNGLLLQIAEDCTANGAGTLQTKLANRLRRTVIANEPIVWSRPTVEFRLISKPSFLYATGYAEGVSLDFVEAIR